MPRYALAIFLLGCGAAVPGSQPAAVGDRNAPTPDDQRRVQFGKPDSSAQRAREEPILITDQSQREAAVDRLVTVVGIQTRSRAPTVAGIEVDGDYQLSDRRVRVTGILKKHVVKPMPPSEPVVARRGPGTYYHLVDPQTGTPPKPVLDE